MAKTIREMDQGNSQLRQSLIEEQTTVTILKSEVANLQQTMEQHKHEAETVKVEIQTKVETLEKNLKAEKENVLKESKKAEIAKTKVEQII